MAEGKPIARVTLLTLPHAEDVGKLIDAIEATGYFQVVANEKEKGGFRVIRREEANDA